MKLVGLDADLFSCMINYIIIEEFILDGYCTVLQFYIFHFEKKYFSVTKLANLYVKSDDSNLWPTVKFLIK